ncbi:hypothetical protein TW95_gp1268 [Pandoravirus inopinatum]|uniref:Uncharacterized protein n=1 Tax=Pandoravirus inopinatum TaxID=1605721 RepID=A0A0B5JE13_9VIRU|nr:hypothetical protein TW95_gp1268 [Pandoravirus inopinatum]AJF98002.1 hypothetical protein [Pandoravirus inopinatum]
MIEQRKPPTLPPPAPFFFSGAATEVTTHRQGLTLFLSVGMEEAQPQRQAIVAKPNRSVDDRSDATSTQGRQQTWTHTDDMPTIDFGDATAARLREYRRSGAWIRLRDGRKVAYPLGGGAFLHDHLRGSGAG